MQKQFLEFILKTFKDVFWFSAHKYAAILNLQTNEREHIIHPELYQLF